MLVLVMAFNISVALASVSQSAGFTKSGAT
jgi:hypothetical protein